ncbi:MAG: hypothetical protein HC849_34770 [Oscillatoriales cyanobacterium RU_3_3]|nr:hypothetical protein [Oscillatoriales cyanobacterium RU_3_3]
MPNCPCCSGPLLHHVRRSKTYWFCPECHQEMPSLEQIIQQKSRSHHRMNDRNISGTNLKVQPA